MPLPVDVDDRLANALVEAAPDGIVIVDGSGTLLAVNRRAEDMFGYDRSELEGTSVDRLVPPDQRARHAVARSVYTAAPRVRPMGAGLDLEAQRRDGSRFPAEISLSPLAAGETVLTIAVVRDITDRVAREAELEDARRRVAVADERERIARDLHDTVIQRVFAVGLLLQGGLGRPTKLVDRAEEAIDELDAAIRDIRGTIFNLRDLPSPSDNGEALRAVIGEAARVLGFEPDLVVEGDLETVCAAEARELVSTLREALTNVAKHARATAVRVVVRVVGDRLVAEVVDDGTGIDPGALGGGSGSGLRNMIGRAEHLGGRCTISSNDPGAHVTWEIPLPPPA